MQPYTYQHYEKELEQRIRKADEERTIQDAIKRQKNRRERKQK